MTALPPLFEAGLAALLVACIIRAFFGPPPSESDSFAAAGWMVAGVALIATVLIAGRDADPRDVLTAAGVMAICVAGWWLRRRDGEDFRHPELDSPEPPGIDWDAFDRERSGWKPRQPA
jgi:hypothetical protein